MSRRLWMILAIGAAALIFGALFGPAAVQRRGAAEARAMRDAVAPVISADPRFAAVGLRVQTNPAVVVYGEVPDDAALADLRRIVVAPPGARFAVGWTVKVAPVAATAPLGPAKPPK